MGEFGRFVDRHWTITATVVMTLISAAISGIALGRDRPGVILPVVGTLVTLLVGIWTVEFLRRDLRLRTRPYLAVVGNFAETVSACETLVVPVLRVAGDYPAVITGQTAVIKGTSSSETVQGAFTQNIVYPGETVNSGRYVVPVGGTLRLDLTYEDFNGRRKYGFGIEYEVGGNAEVSILTKVGD